VSSCFRIVPLALIASVCAEVPVKSGGKISVISKSLTARDWTKPGFERAIR
jgi:hypothetical protein